MAPRKPKPLTIPQAIAAAVRRERKAHEPSWNQEDLAVEMQKLGFPWSRMTVTEIERGDPNNTAATKREQARQVSVEELFGLTFAFQKGLDALLWHERGLELAPADRRAKGGLPLVLNSQLELWIVLMSSASIMKVTKSETARLIDVEKRRVDAAIAKRMRALATELRKDANWYEEQAIEFSTPKEEQ